MILTTTFDKLKLAGACGQKVGCGKGYDKLAQYLGGASKYGKNTPINLLTILDSNGWDDCLWCLRATVEPLGDVPYRIATDIAEFAIKEAKKNYSDPAFKQWADDWLSGKDRSAWEAARAAMAARAARAAEWAPEADDQINAIIKRHLN